MVQSSRRRSSAGRPSSGSRSTPIEGDGAAGPGGQESAPLADMASAARTLCLRALESSPQTRAQLAALLLRKGIPVDVGDAVLDRFTEVGLIDDSAFAAAWVSSRHTGRGLASRALRHELRGRGVEDETVDEAVAALDPDVELATARALVARRLPATRALAPDVRVRRLVRLLARKGYAGGVAYQVVKDAVAADGPAPSAWGELDEIGVDDAAL